MNLKQPTEANEFRKLSPYLLFVIPILFGLYLTSLQNYLLFHTIIEFFAVIVAACVFVITWNSRQSIDNNYLLFVGIAFLFLGMFDMIHALGYKGMGIFPNYDANLPTQLWIAARYYQSVALLVAPLWLHRNLNANRTLQLSALVAAVLLLSIFGRTFPDCYREGSGLTTFKIVSEYIISAILIVALLLLRRERGHFDQQVYRMLVASFILNIGAEIAFTFYVSVYGLSNLIGHYFKLVAFYLIYKSIVQTGFEKPYDLLFRSLKKSEESLILERDMLNQALRELSAQKVTLQAQQEELEAQNEELQAQQEELQAQNEELIETQCRVEESNQKYRDLYDFAPIGYFNLNRGGAIIDANLTGAHLLGYRQKSLEGRLFEFYVAEDSRDIFADHLTRVLNGGGASDEIRMVHQSGRVFPVEIESVSTITDTCDGAFCRFSVRDITERKLAEDRIQASLREKEVLLQEIHHRVKNNLQVIRSLMNLQAGALQDPTLKKPFHEARNRISAMAMIHETLYRSDSFSKIDLRDYVARLVSELRAVHNSSASNIAFSVNVDRIHIGIDQSVPCGLVLNELISNAFKHAFPDNQPGTVKINAFLQPDDHLEISVADDGAGLPKDLEIRDLTSLGMKLIYRLTEGQLGGSVHVENNGGTQFTVRFPLLRGD